MRISNRFPTICVSLIVIILVSLGHPVIGQDIREVEGRVIDASTGAAILNAHVFYSGTSLGDVSNSYGRFQLPHPHVDQVDLIVSMLGYATYKLHIERLTFDYSDLIIKLLPVVFGLDEIEVIAADPAEWRENLTHFKQLLFSTTDYGSECEIENPEVLQLTYDVDRDSLSASASTPLQIVNRALGYQVTVYDVKLDGNEQGYRFIGEMQFQEMTATEAKEQKQWIAARAKIYAGSMRHFLQSLVSNRLESEGFAAYHVTSPWEESTEMPIAEMKIPGRGNTYVIVSPGSSSASRFVSFSGALYIHNEKERKPQIYLRHLERLVGRSRAGSVESHQVSWLTLPLDEAEVDTTGIVFTNVEGFPMAHFGYWAWERFGEMLPTNYAPQHEPQDP